MSVFQSTREAMQIMNSYRQSAHQPIRHFFHHTTPAVRFALGTPLSAQYRTFIHNSQKHAQSDEQLERDDLDVMGVGHRERLLA